MEPQTQEEKLKKAQFGVLELSGWSLMLLAAFGVVCFLLGRGTAPEERIKYVRVYDVTEHLQEVRSIATTTILEEKQKCDAKGGELYLRADSMYGIRYTLKNGKRSQGVKFTSH